MDGAIIQAATTTNAVSTANMFHSIASANDLYASSGAISMLAAQWINAGGEANISLILSSAPQFQPLDPIPAYNVTQPFAPDMAAQDMVNLGNLIDFTPETYSKGLLEIQQNGVACCLETWQLC